MPDPSERGVIPLWRLFATDFVSPHQHLRPQKWLINRVCSGDLVRNASKTSTTGLAFSMTTTGRLIRWEPSGPSRESHTVNARVLAR